MQWRSGKQDIVKDERAQALSEFVVVFPLVLFVFFLMLQYFRIVQTSLVGNYAAYAAARTLAVRTSWDKDAEKNAKIAACLAYAPVSRLEAGEPGVWVQEAIKGLLPSGLPGIFGNVVQLAEGFAVAWCVRLNSLTGGSIDFGESGEDDTAQVSVELHYAFPIALPGVAELWGLVGGDEDIESTLGGGPEFLESGWVWTKLLSPYAYIDIVSKCAMGKEDWSGELRKRNTVDSDAETDPELQEKADKLDEAQKNLDEAKEKLDKEAKERDAAKAEYEKVKEDPDSTGDEIQTAWKKYLKEQNDYEEAAENFKKAQDEYEEATGYSC